MKKILCTLLSILMVLPIFSVQAAAFSDVSENEIVCQEGNSVYCENVTLLNGGEYYCITTRITSPDEPASTYGVVPQHVTVQYEHKINDTNGKLIARFLATVTGEISPTNPRIIAIQGKIYDKTISSTMSYTAEYSNNHGYAHITLAGVRIATFRYKINTSGEISCF